MDENKDFIDQINSDKLITEDTGYVKEIEKKIKKQSNKSYIKKQEKNYQKLNPRSGIDTSDLMRAQMNRIYEPPPVTHIGLIIKPLFYVAIPLILIFILYSGIKDNYMGTINTTLSNNSSLQQFDFISNVTGYIPLVVFVVVTVVVLGTVLRAINGSSRTSSMDLDEEDDEDDEDEDDN